MGASLAPNSRALAQVSAAISANSAQASADAVPKSPSLNAVWYMKMAAVITERATPFSCPPG
jgi:hypothetical protein